VASRPADQGTPSRPGERERQVVGFARGGGLNLVGAVCNQAALLGVTLLVARRLGRVDVGVYAQAYAFLALLSPLSMIGLTHGLTRFVAVYLAERDPGAVRGTVRLGLAASTLVASAVGAALFAAAPLLARGAFSEPRLGVPLQFVALTLPASAFTNAALAATQGYRTMKPFALIGLIFEPVARLLLAGALLLAGMGLRGVMLALLVSNLGAAVLAALALRRVMGPQTAPPTYAPSRLFSFSAVSWSAGLASTALIWADILLLGLLGNSAQVGVYTVATRLVQLATFVMLPINAAFAPRIADLDARGHTESLRHTYQLAESWIVRLSLPGFVLLMVFPADLLALFGRGFAVGAAVTMILAVGKFVDAATGPCGLMLNMSGRPGLNVLDNLVGLVLNVVLNLLLIPRFGIVGSAVAWAVSLCLVNGARVVQVWMAMRMLPFERSAAKGLLAGAAALVAALAVRATLQRPAQLLVGAAVVAVVYLAALLAQGLTAEDRLVARALLRRRPVPAWAGAAPAAGPIPATVGLMIPSGAETPPLPVAPEREWPRFVPERPRFVPERPPRRPRFRPRLSPARYLRALWRRRLVVGAGLLAGVALGVAVLPALLPSQATYRAALRLEVRPLTVDQLAHPLIVASGDELADQVLDVEVASQLLRRLGALPRQLAATRDLQPEQWPTGLMAALRAEAVPGTRSTVELSLVDGSAERARRVVESYARRLVAKRNAIDRARIREAEAVLEQQAGELRVDLTQWGQRVDQERAAAFDRSVSLVTQAQFDAFRERYRAKLAEMERLRELVALRGPATEARLPATQEQASRPRGWATTAGLGVLVGLLAGVLLAWLLEAVRPRVTTAAEAALATGVDTLASVPRRRRWWSRWGRGRQPDAEEDAYRRLALRMERQGLGHGLSVVAVASAELREGKSAVAVGLARALAQRGRAVVVVSGDLRRPVIERSLGLPEVPGLGEYLETSGGDVVSLLVTVRDNLLLLPAGWAGRSPANLLARSNLSEAVGRLRALDLVVLVDTPAARWWSDALAIAAEADATVLVARSGRSRWKPLAELATTLHRDRFPALGVVLVGAGRRPRRVRRGGGAGPVAPTRAASLQDPRQGAGPNGNGHGNGARGHRRAPSRPRRRPG
jgi:O-antigen/teichoic acid export membrane protein/Mrp family chromosome partitioning ATPase